ncbi:MAG TPA: M28 family metallopeptidase [Thermoleophilaceae bacterium]|nr:M28 family metallopeptidase [Thermoleophilaceae bacterium]
MGWQFDRRRAVATAAALAAAAMVAAACGDGNDGSAAAAERVPRPTVDRFDSAAAYELVREQVELGPRPAGSKQSRVLAERLRRMLPNGRFQPVPGGLRNVVGRVPGREPRRVVVVGAHYDTKEIPGFLGAVDGASGTAVVTELARTIRPRELRPTVVFLMFDGEEVPAGKPDSQFTRYGIRGSKAAAPRYRDAEAMILLDFVGERGLRIPRESYSNEGLWQRLRAAARAVGVAKVFPAEDFGAGIQDDHLPFIEQGVPSIDLIDFDFPCWHRRCDDLSRVSERSLDASGETVYELLRRL